MAVTSRCAGALNHKSLAKISSLDGSVASWLMPLTSTTRPSTMPALKVNAGLAFAYAVKGLGQRHRIARGIGDGAHALQFLQQPGGLAALGRLLGDAVLDHLIGAARAANRLAQLEILLHRHLLVARQEDVLRSRQSFVSNRPDLSAFPSYFFMEILLTRPLQVVRRHIQRERPAPWSSRWSRS